MPLFNVNALIDKTLVIKQPTKFYRVADIVSKGDQAKPVSNLLKPGYNFVMDSYLTPTEENTKYGFKTATRSDYYLTWRGRDRGYYAVKYNPSIFSATALKEQGVKTVEQQRKEDEAKDEGLIEKLGKGVNQVFSTGKNILYIGLAVFAAGYLIEKSK